MDENDPSKIMYRTGSREASEARQRVREGSLPRNKRGSRERSDSEGSVSRQRKVPTRMPDREREGRNLHNSLENHIVPFECMNFETAFGWFELAYRPTAWG